AHDLSGPVISNVSAAASLVIFHAFLPQHMLGSQQMFTLSVSSLCDDVRMLAEQQHILNRLGLACRNNALLQRAGLRVANQSQVDNFADSHQSPVTSHDSLHVNLQSPYAC